jgi:glycosyltransferase involved in cell wall biosynthesis
LRALRTQECPCTFEILAVDNNSPDNTLEVLAALANEPGAPLRVVTEEQQGIVPARNRAIAESLERDILVFIDDDEIPQAGWLNAACHSILDEHAQCVGGRIDIDFGDDARPTWLDDEVAGFLGRLDHGSDAFWIQTPETPLWSGNIAYDVSLFRQDPTLRFDPRYNRAGQPMGGGEDQEMFQRLLERGARLRYRPDMAIWHGVENWRLQRRYFLRLHYLAGVRKGLHELPSYPAMMFGAPPFLFRQAIEHWLKVVQMYLSRTPGALRQAMTAAHTTGLISGYRQRLKSSFDHD